MFSIFAVNVCDKDAVAVLNFIVKTIVKVCYPPFRLAQAHGGIVIFVGDFFDKDGKTASAACMNLSSRGTFRLVFDFRFCAAGRTLRWTSRHPELLRLPSNFWVVLAEPGEAEDHGLLAQQSNCELGSLGMAFVVQNDVCDFGDSACLICSSVDVVDRDRSREATGGEVVVTDILSVDEKPSSATVDERARVAL